jgi:signal transduction histidine kinase
LKAFRVFSHGIRSLNFKVLTVVGLVILAMMLGSLLLFKRLADHAQSLLFDAMDAMSYAVHHGLTIQINERYYDVHAFAKNPAVQSLDAAAMAQVLNTFVRLYQIYDVILVTDTQGRYMGGSTIGPDGSPLNVAALRSYDYSQDSWFQAVRYGGTYMDAPSADPYLKRMDRRDVRGNSFASAILDAHGQVLGTICIRAGVRWIETELDRAYDMFQAGGFSVARLELINANGERMVASGPPLQVPGGMERPVRYPGTEERTRTAKIWSLVEAEGGKYMIGSSFLADPAFAPGLGWSLRVTVGSSNASRSLSETVRMSYAWLILAAIGLLFLAFAYIRRLVISRHLQEQVAIRTAELNRIARNLEERNWDLERSRSELQATNDQLIEAQKELLDTAKRLGQAEVASLTLHNIGNIMTSLNVQSTLLRERLDEDAPGQLTLAYLKKLAREAPRGDELPSYLARLEAAESAQLMEIRNLLHGLNDNVRMAMAAISSQLSFVQQNEATEAYRLSELLQHTLVLYFGTFRRHHVKQEMKLQHDVEFLTERFRFESILTVLIRNAIDATEGQVDRRISFATEVDGRSVMLLIRDNGHGFGPDVAAQIFRFGFTTKSDGHGFGLHYAANSCEHLGLELSLDSPGLGLGAIARLRIPRAQILTVMDSVDFSKTRDAESSQNYSQAGAHTS